MIDLPHLHDWPTDEPSAVALQMALADRVRIHPGPDTVRTIGGCDIAYSRTSDELFAVVIVTAWPGGAVIDRAEVRAKAVFPYVPGLLSFREIPPVLTAIHRLRSLPDLFMLDGQGIAHPRRFGLACHLGLWVDRPTIGCAKSWLVGDYTPPGPTAGDHSPLTVGGELVGAVVRSATNVRPVFVSPGHQIDVAGATDVVRGVLSGYRHPVPTRLAHLAGNELRGPGSTEVESA